MADFRIELNSAGVRALLQSAEIGRVCEEQARRMTLATGMKYTADVHVGKNRVNAGGYDRVEGKDEGRKICPSCGLWHPHCHCRTT